MTSHVIRQHVDRHYVSRSATEADLRQIENWEHWHCADAEYRHDYDRPVTLYVHSGAATVAFLDCGSVELQAGDLLTIRKDAKAVWRISQPIHNSYKYHD